MEGQLFFLAEGLKIDYFWHYQVEEGATFCESLIVTIDVLSPLDEVNCTCFPALAYIIYQFDTIPPLQCYTPESLLTLFLYTADRF